MPVIISPEDAQTWLTAPMAEALELQRPAPDEAITLLAREAT
jgi:putative SOS response-associated peptidase YedK